LVKNRYRAVDLVVICVGKAGALHAPMITA